MIKLKHLTIPLLVLSLAQSVYADTFTLQVTPPVAREDGTPLKASELSKCRVWDITDTAKHKSLSSTLLNKPYTHGEDVPGTYKYAADCTDTKGVTSKLSTPVTKTVAPVIVVVTNPAIPGLTTKALANGRVQFTVTPSSKRTDGTPLKLSDLSKCSLFNTTDPKNYKTVSTDMLSGTKTMAFPIQGEYIFGAKCYDTANRASLISTLKRVNITVPAKDIISVCP